MIIFNKGELKDEQEEKRINAEHSQTCDWIKKRLGDKVAKVQIDLSLNLVSEMSMNIFEIKHALVLVLKNKTFII